MDLLDRPLLQLGYGLRDEVLVRIHVLGFETPEINLEEDHIQILWLLLFLGGGYGVIEGIGRREVNHVRPAWKLLPIGIAKTPRLDPVLERGLDQVRRSAVTKVGCFFKLSDHFFCSFSNFSYASASSRRYSGNVRPLFLGSKEFMRSRQDPRRAMYTDWRICMPS